MDVGGSLGHMYLERGWEFRGGYHISMALVADPRMIQKQATAGAYARFSI